MKRTMQKINHSNHINRMNHSSDNFTTTSLNNFLIELDYE